MNNKNDTKFGNLNFNSKTNTKPNSFLGNNSMKSLLKKYTKKSIPDIKQLSNLKKESCFIRSNSQPRLISVIDTNLKHRSRGTNLPAQFNRDNYMNINKFYKTFYDLNNNNGSNKKFQKSKSQSELNLKNYECDNREKKTKPRLWDNIPKNELVNQKDKLMPKGLEFYEKYMRNTCKKNFLENNYIIQKQPNGETKPILIRKINKIKNFDMDYLSNNNNYENKTVDKEYKNNDQKHKKSIEFLESDIFNKKITPAIIKKSGEKKYLKEQLQHNNSENDINHKKYDVSSETTAGWGMRDPLPSLNNHSSLPYNPLNPNCKNICKTKDDIIADSKKNYNNFNPINKQKSVSEYMYLSRVSAPNINEDYNSAFNKNPNIFKRNDDMFSETYKIHHEYENIADKPFQKFIKMDLGFEDNKNNINFNNQKLEN